MKCIHVLVGENVSSWTVQAPPSLQAYDLNMSSGHYKDETSSFRIMYLLQKLDMYRNDLYDIHPQLYIYIERERE